MGIVKYEVNIIRSILAYTRPKNKEYLRVLRNLKNFSREKSQNLSGIFDVWSGFLRPSHFNVRYAVLQKFLGALHKAALFVQAARVHLCFELYRVSAEDAVCGGSRRR